MQWATSLSGGATVHSLHTMSILRTCTHSVHTLQSAPTFLGHAIFLTKGHCKSEFIQSGSSLFGKDRQQVDDGCLVIRDCEVVLAVGLLLCPGDSAAR